MLEQRNNPEKVNVFAPGVAFFVLTFQDILRITESKITHPELLMIAQYNRQEDLGHEQWFLQDLHQLGINCDAFLLFGQEYFQTRDTSFEIISEIYQASDDRIRLVIPLALEAAGHVFFSRVHQLFYGTKYHTKLKYFSQEHFQIELNHTFRQEDINNMILSIELTDELYQEAMQVVDRVFTALSNMLCSLNHKITKDEERTVEKVY
ncbi:conserved hypothetical protein [Rippkaea orientalis PCC 8801]|uniref:Uncharacterized protein n=1 Tax=Rippkaea orientalis (strain PCC 8801 / RF-1) TaxID=41431 RepID=B7K5A7_RIPO1|nr:hypothetical protein [Rippkaea orientalis]ACK67933.1 conserved hypothetical protein [Rippkaea orientalis PCC 8801]